MKKIKIITFISSILLILLLVITFLAFRAEFVNNQRMFMILAGAFLIIFGFLIYLETKLKWLEKKEKRD
jgi:cytochrome c biogenesis protein CcdA